MQTFNEWMVHIHKELGYPESKIKLYEQNCGSKTDIQNNQRCVNTDRGDADIRKDKDNTSLDLS